MTNEKDTKTRSTSGASPKTARSKSNPNADLSGATTSAPQAINSRKPVSTSEPTVITARNTTIQGNAVISADDIRRRAYELYEQRGRTAGFHEQDWQAAESQLRNRKNSAQAGSQKKSA